MQATPTRCCWPPLNSDLDIGLKFITINPTMARRFVFSSNPQACIFQVWNNFNVCRTVAAEANCCVIFSS